MIKLLLTICFALTYTFATQSCYDYYKVEQKETHETLNTAVFILIDETTVFDENLKKQVWDNALKFVHAGNYIYVAKFSAFINNNYNTKVFDFSLDFPLAEKDRYNARKDTLAKLDKCLNDQYMFVGQGTQKAIFESFQNTANTISKSDILFALKDFGENIIEPTKAQRKIVILASDMLENSSISSFYSNGAVRLITPKEEIDKVTKNSLFSHFGGSEVYIVGAGLVSSPKGDTYRDPKKLVALKDFWDAYFQKSHAKLVEMGQPSLKKLIQ